MIATQSKASFASGAVEARDYSKLPLFCVWLCDPWCRTPWYTGALTRALQNAGHAVRLVCPSYHLEPDYFRTQGLRPRPGVTNLAALCGTTSNRLLRSARLVEYGVNAVALGIQATVNPPQIVHQQQCVLLEHGWKTELAFLRWCRGRGVRVVYTAHNLLPHEQRPFHAEIYAELYRIADALICHDPKAAMQMNEEFGMDRRRIHVIPHGPLFAEAPPLSTGQCKTTLGLHSHRQLYLALGVLARYKGLDLLLEAWSDLMRMDRKSPKPLLVIAGNGPESEKAQLRERAANLGIDQETLRLDLGYIPAARLPLYMQAADVLLYPYREITTSGALLAGLNYCKPIVASDLATFRNYLDPNVNALVVTPGDRNALTKAMAELRDQAVFASLEAGSRNNGLLQMQWEEIAALTAKVYGTVVE